MPDFRERVAARDYARNHAIAYRKDNNTLRPWLAYAECRRAGVPIPPPANLSESDANTKAFVDLDNLERDLNVWLGRASEYRAWLATQRRDWPTMGQGI